MPIKDLFNKQKTEPQKCGGNDTTQDPKAPMEIVSEDMILFDATSALDRGYIPSSEKEYTLKALVFVSAFAAPAGNHTFLFLETGDRFERRAEKMRSWAYVKENIFPSLVKLVRDRNIAKNNGYHSKTHGLPENFGGSVDIRYASGEKISFSDNGRPILTCETAAEIVKLFTTAMQGERVELPDVSALQEIRFEELLENGGFKKAILTIQSDGTGINAKQSRYDDPTVYESKKPVDAGTIVAIKKNIENTGILAWSGLPSNGYSFGGKKQITFVFEDGTEITVNGDRLLPGQINQGFFNIELEMVTKH